MKNQNEYDKRCKAIQLHNKGYGFNKILQLVQRSRRWLSKWLKRSTEQGIKGLEDQSRAPKRIWRKTSDRLGKKILAIRKKMGDLHQTDLVGPRYINGPNGVTRFYSFHTVDVADHTAHTNQFTDKQTISLCRHLVEAWRFLGIPRVSQMDNEMCATGGGRYSYSLSQVIRLHLLLGIHMVFIPPGEPGRNASVESFNKLWQERVLRRHNCPTLAALKRTSERFLRYYHYKKPHRGLTQKEHGTRFPGVLRDYLWKSLTHLPEDFTLDKYMDPKSHLNLPIAKGKVSFIRKVDPHGRIELNGATYFIKRKLERQYVVATLFTHRKRLVVKQDNKIIKSFSFPIKDHIIEALVPNTKKET